jgi:Protein of unknown function (DUF1674)
MAKLCVFCNLGAMSEKPKPLPLPLSPEAASLRPPPANPVPAPLEKVSEAGGPKGLEPTRYGDWEKKGRCSDF